jgi:hypothetical protein
MKHIRHFEGLSQNNPSKEDILDYFYELTDSREISFVRTDLTNFNKPIIEMIFTIKKRMDTDNLDQISEMVKFLSKIESIGRRWKLSISMDLRAALAPASENSTKDLTVHLDANPKIGTIMSKYGFGSGERHLENLVPSFSKYQRALCGNFRFDVDDDFNYLLIVDTRIKDDITEEVKEHIRCELDSVEKPDISRKIYKFRLIL